MPVNIGGIRAYFGLDPRPAKKGMKEAEKAVRDGSKNINKTLGSLKGALAGVFVGFGGAQLAKDFLAASIEMDRMSKALAASTGGMTQGASATKFLRMESERLGLVFQSQIKDYSQLAASSIGTQLEGQKTRDVWTSLAQAATALQLSAADTTGVIWALRDMMSKGSVQSEELKRQLGNRLPGAFQIASDAMGVTTKQLIKMMETGKLMTDDFLPKFAMELDKRFGSAWKNASKSMQAETNRMLNAWFEFRVEFMRATELDKTYVKSVKALADALETMGKYSKEIGGALKTIAEIAVVFGATWIALKVPGFVIASVHAYRMSLMSANAAAVLFGGTMATLQGVLNILGAAFVGWKVGTYLSDNFAIARKAGVFMVDVLMKGWILLKGGFNLAITEMMSNWIRLENLVLHGTIKIQQSILAVQKGMNTLSFGNMDSMVKRTQQAILDMQNKVIDNEMTIRKRRNDVIDTTKEELVVHDDIIGSLYEEVEIWKKAKDGAEETADAVLIIPKAIKMGNAELDKLQKKLDASRKKAREGGAEYIDMWQKKGTDDPTGSRAKADIDVFSDEEQLRLQQRIFDEQGIMTQDFYNSKKELLDEDYAYMQETLTDQLAAYKWYTAELKKLNDQMGVDSDTMWGEMSKKFRDYGKDMQSVGASIGDAFIDAFGEVKQSILDTVDTGIPLLDNLLKKIMDAMIEAYVLKPLINSIGNMGGSSGGGGFMGFFGSLFGGGGGGIAMANGGVVNEEIMGVGLSSGTGYNIGESGKEFVLNEDQMKSATSGSAPIMIVNVDSEEKVLAILDGAEAGQIFVNQLARHPDEIKQISGGN